MIGEITTHRINSVEVTSENSASGTINWIDIKVKCSKGEKFRFVMFPEGGSDGTLKILEQIRESASDAINKATGG